MLPASVVLGWMLAMNGFAQDTNSSSSPQFLGAQSCATSGCHGGAAEKSNQYTLWSSRDFHHARPFATLQTARSERMAEVLKIRDAAQSAQCTVCHAPFQTLPPGELGKTARIAEGVSCESCHGPAEKWLRSHTRPDYTQADRVAAGMRDLKNLYVRANTCVACHQNLPGDIRAAGHPELIFEMDGQSATQPRHWREIEAKSGPKSWFIGQAVALREMSWQLASEQQADNTLSERASGLLWVLRAVTRERIEPPAINGSSVTPENANTVRQWSDDVAKAAMRSEPADELTRRGLLLLAGTSEEFTDRNVPPAIHARRAERLVLGLDRLVLGLDNVAKTEAVNRSLNKLFTGAQSLPDFNPTQFANDLKEFQASVSAALENK